MPIRLTPIGLINQPITFKRAVAHQVQRLNKTHHLARGVPRVHKHCSEGQALVVHHVGQHLLHMIEFVFVVPFGVVYAKINDLVRVNITINVNAVDHPNAFDQAMRVAAVLTAHQFNAMGKIFIQHHVIKNDVSFGRVNNIATHVVPHIAARDTVFFEISIDRVVAHLLSVLRKIRQRVVDLADQQILAIIQAIWFHRKTVYSTVTCVFA
jgi:hypothetical protein